MITRPLLLAAAVIVLSYGSALAQSNSATECGTAGCVAPGQTHQSLGDGTNVGPGSTTGTGMGPQSDDANRLRGGTAMAAARTAVERVVAIRHTVEHRVARPILVRQVAVTDGA